MNSKWYVYLISSGNQNNSPVKIGIAKDPKKRITDLQVGNLVSLKLLSSIECRSRKHAHHLENWLHKCFSKYHIRGEWFKGKYLNLPRALAGFDTDVELTNERHKGIHGTKAQEKMERLHGRNVVLQKALQKVDDKIDEELDRITLAHLDKFY